MTDPVHHVSRLRKHSLLVNAVCSRWEATQQLPVELVEQCALLTRRLARVTTVWLFALRSRRFHPDPSLLSDLTMALNAWIRSVLHRSEATRLRWLSEQVGKLDRESATIRTMTPSPEINEMLGRYQPTLNALKGSLRELTCGEMAVVPTGANGHQRLAIFVPRDRWPHFSV